VIAAEVCSATFLAADHSPANLVATALFADGAAAAVLAPDGPGPALLAARARLLDDSEDVMGWTLRPGGLQVRFARSIPAIVREVVPSFVAEAAAAAGLAADALEHLVVHPGGARVLRAYEDALAVAPDRLADARAVLRDHGNMSSPTALFVLAELLRSTPARDAPGLLLGLGPGFCAEAMILRW
jgi:alkylresorcinol/alkylpyrone synthase